MKNSILIAALLVISFGFAQNYTESFSASDFSDFEAFDTFETPASEGDQFGFVLDAEIGDVAFNAPEKIDLINVYNSDNQEIFSASGTTIEDGKINVLFLPAGTYYLEVVIGKNRGAQQLVMN